MSGYTLANANFSVKNLLKIKGLELQLLVRNLLNKAYSGMGRQSGNAIRPIDEWQTRIRNPDGFVSPYHPQPRREIFLQVSYEF
jgi:outer membrane receptor protein involved in Fe transport